MANDVVDNPERQRFELIEDGLTAFANYRRSGANLLIPHVESPPSLRGKGTAGRLMEGVVALARANGDTITPLCSYARTWFLRHPEHGDLLHAEPPSGTIRASRMFNKN
jgi:predicted GNAT family acetyltransferase